MACRFESGHRHHAGAKSALLRRSFVSTKKRTSFARILAPPLKIAIADAGLRFCFSDSAGIHSGHMTYCDTLRLKGYLLEPEVKQYEDLRVIDLLPDGVHYAKIYMIQQGNTGGPILDGGTKYQPEIIENYYNSGRTAVIFHLNAENLKKSLDVHTTYTDIYFGVTIDQDAHPGKVRNYVYAVGDNLEE